MLTVVHYLVRRINGRYSKTGNTKNRVLSDIQIDVPISFNQEMTQEQNPWKKHVAHQPEDEVKKKKFLKGNHLKEIRATVIIKMYITVASYDLDIRN